MTRLDSSVRVLLALGAVVLIIGGTAGAVPGERMLVVERVDTGERIIADPVTNGTVVELEYMHSVEKTRVVDEYTVRGDRLVNTRMAFESYGWGLPAQADVSREDGMFVYDPPGELRQLTVKPGTVSNHSLTVGDRRYDLVERSNASSVTISLRRGSVLTDVIHGRMP